MSHIIDRLHAIYLILDKKQYKYCKAKITKSSELYY
jgi:hypothetical protein